MERAPCFLEEVSLLSPTYDFKIFRSKISSKTPHEVFAAAIDEIHRLEFASPRMYSGSFAYLRDLRLLASYIHAPPQPGDPRGPVSEQIKQTLQDLGLLGLPREEQPHVDP
jgi:hypothetical protein